MRSLKLDAYGYLADVDGTRFIAVGANYWPASCGVEMWRAWPENEIFADLDLMASLGFNTVRFFVRWPDFEPQPGDYDTTALARLLRFLDACVERGLRPQPSLFVGWMSGGVFWPEWKAGRNLFAEPFLIERAAAFARMLATHLKPFAAQLCGIDLGNELNALPESQEAAPAQVREWCRRMTEAIRGVLPGTLILSGCDHQQVIADTGWRLGDQPGIDVQTMHGYPVPGWHPVPCGGLQDALTQSLLPFYVKCARAFGPVMLQEFGTILTSAEAASHADAYLRAILPDCRKAGANGYLWWCFKDIPARVHPYLKNNFESQMGLVDAEGRVKPGLEFFSEFTREVTQGRDGGAGMEADVHLYWPANYYDRGEARNPGNRPREASRRLIIAHHLLERAGHRVAILRGDRPIPSGVRRIVVPGVFLSLDEVEALGHWVEQGGHLLWHGPDPLGWGTAATRLIGAAIVDYHAGKPIRVVRDGIVYPLARHPREIRLEVALCGARQVCADADGFPVILRRSLGKGQVITVLPDVEESILLRWQEGDEAVGVDWYFHLSTEARERGMLRSPLMDLAEKPTG